MEKRVLWRFTQSTLPETIVSFPFFINCHCLPSYEKILDQEEEFILLKISLSAKPSGREKVQRKRNPHPIPNFDISQFLYGPSSRSHILDFMHVNSVYFSLV